MSILRQGSAQELTIEKPKSKVYEGFHKAAMKCGKIKGGSDSMGTIVVKMSGGTMTNYATIRVSVSTIETNKTRVQLNSESLDGAVGFGSAGKAIDRLVEVAGGIIHGYEVKQPSAMSGVLKAVLLGVALFLVVIILVVMSLV